MIIVSLLLLLKLRRWLSYNVSAVKQIECNLKQKINQKILTLYDNAVLQSLKLIYLPIVHDYYHNHTQDGAFILQLKREQIRELNCIMIFFLQKHIVTQQEIACYTKIIFHTLSIINLVFGPVCSAHLYKGLHICWLIVI